MGLCKCRTVTNLFCFEHRKNVCERCILSDHPTCYVKAYLQWLQDSEFDSSCQVCKQPLQGDLTRLPCLDLFHTACLEQKYSALPEFTAPAGYACPTCSAPAWPEKDSPVAIQVREKLGGNTWAKRIASIQQAASNVTENGKANGVAPVPADATLPSSIGIGSTGQPNVVPSSQHDAIVSIPSVPRKQRSEMQLDADDDKYSKGQDGWNVLEMLKPKGRLTAKRIVLYLLVIGFVFFVLSSAKAYQKPGNVVPQRASIRRKGAPENIWDDEEE